MKRQNGFLLLTELLLSAALLLLLLGFAFAALQYQEKKQAVDLTARELAMNLQYIRQLHVGNNVGKSTWRATLTEEGYYFQHDMNLVKVHYYPPLVRGSRGVINFDVRGRPAHNMSVTLSSPDKTYSRKIILAAQTGRIRLE